MDKFWTIGDLIAKLQEMNQDRLILLSSDSEGNSFRPLDDFFWEGAYNPETGDIGLETLTDEDEIEGYTDEDVIKGGKPVLILYPK